MGRARVLLFLYSYRNTYGVPTMCLALTRNVPTPPPPGHPAQHVPDQVPQKLIKSPESDRTMCSGVSGSSPPPPETSWLPGSRRPPQVAMCPLSANPSPSSSWTGTHRTCTMVACVTPRVHALTAERTATS